jgi:hypothetical protein
VRTECNCTGVEKVRALLESSGQPVVLGIT